MLKLRWPLKEKNDGKLELGKEAVAETLMLVLDEGSATKMFWPVPCEKAVNIGRLPELLAASTVIATAQVPEALVGAYDQNTDRLEVPGATPEIEKTP